MNGKRKDTRWGRPLLSLMQDYTVGIAAGAPRMLMIESGKLFLVPTHSLPTFRCGDEDFFLRPPVVRGSRRQSPTAASCSLHLILE